MQTIRRRWRRDIIVLGPEEMHQIDWSTVDRGCIYLDIWGNFHIELGHRGFQHRPWNCNWWHLFVRQDLLYQDMPRQLLQASKSQNPRDLIGARQFAYNHKAGALFPSNCAILPWTTMQARGDETRNPQVGEVRRHAWHNLFGILDRLALCLGATFAFMPTSTVADEKMKAYGGIPTELKGWKERLFKLVATFPLRNQRVYLKIYK